MKPFWEKIVVLGLCFSFLTACDVPPVVTPGVNTPQPVPTISGFVPDRFGYTYTRPDGNRYLPGRATLPNSTPIEITLSGRPVWLTSVPYPNGSLWMVALEDGTLQVVRVTGTQAEVVMNVKDLLQPGQPFALIANSERFTLSKPLPSVEKVLSHPIPLLNGTELRVAIDNTGQLIVLQGEKAVGALPVQALLDGRMVTDETGRVLLLTNPSNRYPHGVLGDELEPTTLLVLETNPIPQIVAQITVPEPQVIEGVIPLWADLTGDGVREIILTLSDDTQGAQVVIFNEQGEQIGQSDPLGQGQRWRNTAAVAPFGPAGELELVEVSTPHLEGVVQFLQFQEGQLTVVAQLAGYTSHVSGSVNVDMAVAGDFNGDNRPELVLPTLDLLALAGIQHTSEGAEELWRLTLPAALSTNLSALTTENGQLVLGVGTADNKLRIWP